MLTALQIYTIFEPEYTDLLSLLLSFLTEKNTQKLIPPKSQPENLVAKIGYCMITIRVMGLLNKSFNENDLAGLLASDEITIAGIAHNIRQAMALFKKTRPRVVIMDIDWPALPGMLEEMAAFFFDTDKSVKLVGISDQYDHENIPRLRSARVTGYICWNKDVVRDPVKRIIRVFNGEWAINPDYEQ
jgi:hypothetical protein